MVKYPFLEYGRSLLRWWWVIVVGFFSGLVGLYRELAKQENWPWIAAMVAGVLIAQMLAYFDLWNHQRSGFVLREARKQLEETLEKGREILERLKVQQNNVPLPDFEKEIRSWVEEAADTVLHVRGEPASNELTRAWTQYEKDGPWSKNPCRTVAQAVCDYLNQVIDELTEPAIREDCEDWLSEQQSLRT